MIRYLEILLRFKQGKMKLFRYTNGNTHFHRKNLPFQFPISNTKYTSCYIENVFKIL